MDVHTGKIDLVTADPEKRVSQVPVDMSQATPKQRPDRHVSPTDHSSPLGRQLHEERRKRGLTQRQYRTLRKKGKLR